MTLTLVARKTSLSSLYSTHDLDEDREMEADDADLRPRALDLPDRTRVEVREVEMSELDDFLAA